MDLGKYRVNSERTVRRLLRRQGRDAGAWNTVVTVRRVEEE